MYRCIYRIVCAHIDTHTDEKIRRQRISTQRWMEIVGSYANDDGVGITTAFV